MYNIIGIETIEYKRQIINKYYIGIKCEEGYKPFGYCLGDYHLRAGDSIDLEFGNSSKGYYIKKILKKEVTA